MEINWLYRLFIQAITFTGDHAYVVALQKKWVQSEGIGIIILDSDYEIDRKMRRLTIYYVPNNFITRLLGFEKKECLLNMRLP